MAQHKHILIVEDDPELVALYQAWLEDEGYEVHSARNGWDALKQYEQDPPDLVVLDLHMPGMDGLELLYRLLDRKRDLPVVINTADPTFETNYLTWPARAYFLKNQKLAKLTDTISELLGN